MHARTSSASVSQATLLALLSSGRRRRPSVMPRGEALGGAAEARALAAREGSGAEDARAERLGDEALARGRREALVRRAPRAGAALSTPGAGERRGRAARQARAPRVSICHSTRARGAPRVETLAARRASSVNVRPQCARGSARRRARPCSRCPPR